jgi:hypothetical protein
MSQDSFKPQLVRIELGSRQVAPGQSLGVVYWWNNAGTAAADDLYMVFVHPRLPGAPEDNVAYPMFGGDFAPAPDTMHWMPGEVHRSRGVIHIPDNAKPGVYDLLLGLYAKETGQRLALANPDIVTADGRCRAASFEVVAAGQAPALAPLVVDLAPMPPQPPTAKLLRDPARTVVIQSGALRVVLDATRATICRYESGDKALRAEFSDSEPSFLIGKPSEKAYKVTGQKGVKVVYDAPKKASESEASYRAHITDGAAPAADCTLRFAVTGRTLAVSLQDVTEHPGYQFMSVTLPRLATTLKADRGNMVLPSFAGRLVSPATALPEAQEHYANWFTIRTCGAIVNPDMLATVDVPSQEDVLLSSVADVGADETAASLSARLTYRVRAAKPELQFIAHRQTAVRLDFATAAPDGTLSWTDAAKVLRSRITFTPPSIYRGAVLYKIFCDTPGAKTYTTFDQASDLVRKLHNLTDGMPQIAYLVGWQHRGHDTGYPDVFTVNERLGGYAKLCQVMKEAEKYNAVISFHDNYDDAYKDSPAWSDDIMARDDNGEIMKGGVWAGGQSYIISYAAFLNHGGLERVRRTLRMFPIRKSYHIDVLSAAPERRDWNPAHPVSADEMAEARRAIIHEFNKAGVDVTSEGFTGPMLGTIGHAWHIWRRRDTVYSGDTPIPFIPFIYHGHATSGGGVDVNSPADYMDVLLYGNTFSNDYTRETPLSYITDQVFLVSAPFQALREREMQRYEAKGTRRTIWYGDDTYVRVDEAAGPHGSFDVVVDGDVIARDYNILVPATRAGAYLCYSKAGGEVRMPLPKALRGATTLTATMLTAEGRGAPVPCQVEGTNLILTLPAQQPAEIHR